MRRWPIVLISGGVGAALGALVAIIGSSQVFVCRDNPPVITAVCAGDSDILAVMWGVPIGLVVGLAGGLAITHLRRSDSGISS